MICNAKKKKNLKSLLFLSRFSVALTVLKTPELILRKHILYPLLQNTKKVRVNLNLLREFTVPSNLKLWC